jgi:hypothetical protein
VSAKISFGIKIISSFNNAICSLLPSNNQITTYSQVLTYMPRSFI